MVAGACGRRAVSGNPDAAILLSCDAHEVSTIQEDKAATFACIYPRGSFVVVTGGRRYARRGRRAHLDTPTVAQPSRLRVLAASRRVTRTTVWKTADTGTVSELAAGTATLQATRGS